MRYDKSKILEKTNRRCAYCGFPLSKKTATIDHIIPKSKFIDIILWEKEVPGFLKHLTIHDLNHLDNLFACCITCNVEKANKNLERCRGLGKNETFYFETIILNNNGSKTDE